ncbi:hypothetical protein OIU78_028462 [Salix suchowensis]|nr:hypothetical protein OIU78_028462 [Salix suchowensis]
MAIMDPDTGLPPPPPVSVSVSFLQTSQIPPPPPPLLPQPRHRLLVFSCRLISIWKTKYSSKMIVSQTACNTARFYMELIFRLPFSQIHTAGPTRF